MGLNVSDGGFIRLDHNELCIIGLSHTISVEVSADYDDLMSH